MKRIAAPMIGGVVTSTILELVIYPTIYVIWRGRQFKKWRLDSDFDRCSSSTIHYVNVH